MPKITIEYTEEEKARFPDCSEDYNNHINTKDLIVIMGEPADDHTLERHVILCFQDNTFLPDAITALVEIYHEDCCCEQNKTSAN